MDKVGIKIKTGGKTIGVPYENPFVNVIGLLPGYAAVITEKP